LPEGVTEVPDVADLPLHLAEGDRPLRIQDARDRTRVALVDHLLAPERLELRLARGDLQVAQHRTVPVESRPVGLEEGEGVAVFGGRERADRGVREWGPEQLERVEVDRAAVRADPR